MKIAVFGAGGMGGYFGGLLARAGMPVTFIARGAHGKALQEQGLTLHTATSGTVHTPVTVTDAPASVGLVDLLLVCVKTYDLAQAARAARPLIGSDTLVLSVQNGIDSVQQIRTICRQGRYLPGVSYVGAHIEGPGIVRQGALSGELSIGAEDQADQTEAQQVTAMFQQAGIQARFRVDIETALWEKFILVCGTGGVLALARQPMGGILAHPETTDLLLGVMTEVESVGHGLGAMVPAGSAQKQFTFATENFAADGYSSMALDLLAGRRLELDALNGSVVRLGRQVGAQTPLNATVYAALKPYNAGVSFKEGAR